MSKIGSDCCFGKPLRAEQAGVAFPAGPALPAWVVAGRGETRVETEGEGEPDDVGLCHGEEGRSDPEASALAPGFRPEPRDTLEGGEELGAAVGVAGIVERIRADDDLRRAPRLGKGEGEGEEERVSRGHVRHGDPRLPERLLRNADRAVRQRRTAERAEGRDRDHAVRGNAVVPRESARRLQLDAVALAVVEGERVDGPAPARRERETRRRVETAGEEHDARARAPRRSSGNRCRRGRRIFSWKVKRAAHLPGTSPQSSLWIWKVKPKFLFESRTHSATSAATFDTAPLKTGDIRTACVSSRRCSWMRAIAQSKSRRSATTNFTSSFGPSSFRFSRSLRDCMPEPGHFTSRIFTTRGSTRSSGTWPPVSRRTV